jgi:hypothetical protein
MKYRFAVASVFLGLLLQTPVQASPFKAGMADIKIEDNIDNIQYSRRNSREFRRCMRAKYGPRYFRGVPRAVRFNMARACGG